MWNNEAYPILEFKLEADAVPYVVPVVRKVLRSMWWEGEGTISTQFLLNATSRRNSIKGTLVSTRASRQSGVITCFKYWVSKRLR